MITLGIIGVVAALTIPTLIANIQKRSVATQLKKTYSTLSQAVRTSEAENGELAGWYITSKNTVDFFDMYIAPFLKASKKTFKANDLIYYTPGGKRESGLAILRGGGAAYTLLSGVQILVNNGTVTGVDPQAGAGSGFGYIIDLNGYQTKPNKFGRDAFYVTVSFDRGVYLSYSDDGELGLVRRNRKQLLNGPSKYNYQCNKNGRGIWCGALIQTDSWTISKDYPW